MRLASSLNFIQLTFIQTQWLFTENVLARIERSQNLVSVLVMASGNDDCIDFLVTKKACLVCSTSGKSKFSGCRCSPCTVACAQQCQRATRRCLDGGKQYASREVAGT